MGSIIIISGLAGIILKRYLAEFIILTGLFLISYKIHMTFYLIMAILLVLVGCYDLIQMWIIYEENQASNKKIIGEELLSAYRKKELLHNLLKMIRIVK